MSSLIITAVNDTSLDADNDYARLVKVEAIGTDVQTPTQLAPYGIDSVPIKDVRAAMANSSVNGEPFLLGVINTDNKAEPGEFRAFATNADGALKLYIWIKADGTLLLGGDVDNAVRFMPLQTGFNQLVDDVNAAIGKLNDLVDGFNNHLHPTTTPGAPTGPPTPLPGLVPAMAAITTNAEIDDSKIDEIKTL